MGRKESNQTKINNKKETIGIANGRQDKGGDRAGITISKGLKMIESKNLVEDKVEAVWCNMKFYCWICIQFS